MNLGVDYSITSPAVCLLEGKIATFHLVANPNKFGSPIDVETPNGWSLHFRFIPPVDSTSPQARYHALADWAMSILPPDVKLDSARIEGYAFGAKGRVFDIAEATQTFKGKLWRDRGIELEKIAIQTLKKEATGHGHAGKDAMALAFEALTGLPMHSVLKLKKFSDAPSTDAVDAFYAAGAANVC